MNCVTVHSEIKKVNIDIDRKNNECIIYIHDHKKGLHAIQIKGTKNINTKEI